MTQAGRQTLNEHLQTLKSDVAAPTPETLKQFKTWLYQEKKLAMTTTETYAWSAGSAFANYRTKPMPRGYLYSVRAWIKFQGRTTPASVLQRSQLIHETCAVCGVESELISIRVCATHARELLEKNAAPLKTADFVPGRKAVERVPIVKKSNNVVVNMDGTVSVELLHREDKEAQWMLMDAPDWERIKRRGPIFESRISVRSPLSRTVLELDKSDTRQVVHKNGDKFDLRRCNLALTDLSGLQINAQLLRESFSVRRTEGKYRAHLSTPGDRRIYGPPRASRIEAENDYKVLLLERGYSYLFEGKQNLKNEADDGVIFRGEHYESLSEIVRQHGVVEENLVRSRISKGWSVERAVVTPAGKIGRPRFLDVTD